MATTSPEKIRLAKGKNPRNMSYDSILKFWIDEYTQPILSWLLNTPVEEKVEILKTELNVEPIRADGVFF